MKDDLVYLRHILESIGRVREFTRGVSEERFLKDALVQSAVIRQLEIIGEAVKNLSPSFRKRHKNVPTGSGYPGNRLSGYPETLN